MLKNNLQRENDKPKTLRFEIFQEVDVEVNKKLIGKDLDNYLDAWVMVNFPHFFRGDYEIVETEEKKEGY